MYWRLLVLLSFCLLLLLLILLRLLSPTYAFLCAVCSEDLIALYIARARSSLCALHVSEAKVTAREAFWSWWLRV